MNQMILYKINKDKELETVKTFDNSFLGFPTLAETLLKKYNFNFDFRNILEDYKRLAYLSNYLTATIEDEQQENFYDLICYSLLGGSLFRHKDISLVSHALMKYLRNNESYFTQDQVNIRILHKELVNLTTDKNTLAFMITPMSKNDVWYDAFHTTIDGVKTSVKFPFLNPNINIGNAILMLNESEYQILKLKDFEKQL